MDIHKLPDKDISLYIHIPFCIKKCAYCDFYSVPLIHHSYSPGNFTETLLRETERRLPVFPSVNIPSVYIGGGTPSVLGADGIAGLLDGLAGIIGSKKPGEITVEANPETADTSFLRSCADHGVTRLSLGIQSFNEKVRKAAGRRGGIFLQRIFEAKEIFGPLLSLDLMSGLPGQNEAMLMEDIKQALSFEPGHISLYALTLEEGNPLMCCSPMEETAEKLWLTGRDALKKAGYEHYEISNFALAPSYRCTHNIRYWRMKNWIGIGPSASGTIIADGGSYLPQQILGRRYTYTPDIEAFQNQAVPPLMIEELDSKTVLKETLLMGFRYIEGPDPVLFIKRFGKKIEEAIPQTLAKWQNRCGNLSLQETIMCFLNSFLLDAFLEIDKYMVNIGENEN